MTGSETPPPLFASKWQFLDAVVLFAVRDTPQGESPMVVAGEGGDFAMAWVDQARAATMLPEGSRLVQAPVAKLLEVLPSLTGLLVEPGSPQALVVSPEYREQLRPLAVPFPPGLVRSSATPRRRPRRSVTRWSSRRAASGGYAGCGSAATRSRTPAKSSSSSTTSVTASTLCRPPGAPRTRCTAWSCGRRPRIPYRSWRSATCPSRPSDGCSTPCGPSTSVWQAHRADG